MLFLLRPSSYVASVYLRALWPERPGVSVQAKAVLLATVALTNVFTLALLLLSACFLLMAGAPDSPGPTAEDLFFVGGFTYFSVVHVLGLAQARWTLLERKA